ncbi:hypothetical protein K469DRAFT_592024 [Zopfia rhizophila CBS 207.26]|uniref:Uncharacterized protein n=1 Tax=Zopfia rhizophila CBS 207.26 TaxID=1314779 RepID=A0A6A6DRL0_9PEZI|nr:hypothetical protein K469DRAFT_592024 [Zopfia rhizophila CBS 207.26]
MAVPQNSTSRIVNSSTSERYYTFLDTNVPMTTLCDGYPRAVRPILTYWFTNTSTYYNRSQTLYTYFPAVHTEIRPTCTIQDQSPECTSVWEAYDYTSRSWRYCDRNRRSTQARPPCYSQQACPTQSTPYKCHVDGRELKLLYWPVTTAGDFCGNKSTITPTPTGPGPNTAVYNGATYTSPTVYMILNAGAYMSSVKTRGQTWHTCGSTLTSLTLSLHPIAVSSIIKPDSQRTRRGRDLDSLPFDFVDLETVPASVYFRGCTTCVGKTINAPYKPLVAVPTEITKEDKAWGACGVWGLMDPELVPLGVERTTTPVATSLPQSAEASATVTENADFV